MKKIYRFKYEVDDQHSYGKYWVNKDFETLEKALKAWKKCEYKTKSIYEISLEVNKISPEVFYKLTLKRPVTNKKKIFEILDN